jgi:hypothetical protein
MEGFAYRLEALGELRAMDRLRGVESEARARVSLVPASPPPPLWTPAAVFVAMSVCATP